MTLLLQRQYQWIISGLGHSEVELGMLSSWTDWAVHSSIYEHWSSHWWSSFAAIVCMWRHFCISNINAHWAHLVTAPLSSCNIQDADLAFQLKQSITLTVWSNSFNCPTAKKIEWFSQPAELDIDGQSSVSCQNSKCTISTSCENGMAVQ